MQNVKLAVVGEETVGKTSLVLTCANNEFPSIGYVDQYLICR